MTGTACSSSGLRFAKFLQSVPHANPKWSEPTKVTKVLKSGEHLQRRWASPASALAAQAAAGCSLCSPVCWSWHQRDLLQRWHWSWVCPRLSADWSRAHPTCPVDYRCCESLSVQKHNSVTKDKGTKDWHKKKSMQSDFTTKGYIARALHCFLSITVDPQVRSYLKIQLCVMPSTEAKWFLSVSLDSITTGLPFRCDQQEAEAASRFQTHTGNSKRSSGRWRLRFDFSRTQDFYLQGAHHS